MPGLSRETQILCAILGRTPERACWEGLSDLPEAEWKHLMEKAEEQGVFGLIGDRVREWGGHPAGWEERLKRHEARSFNLSIRLLKIIGRLRAENILAIPVKGPLLAEYLYGDVGKRSFADLDIFIFEEDLFRAVQALGQAGYVPELTLTGREMRKFARQEYDFKLYDAKTHTLIELHWELSGRYTQTPMVLATYADHLETGTVLGKDVPRLPKEVDFLYLCLHSAKHCFEKLEMVFSIAVYAGRFSEGEMQNLLEKASAMKCRRIVLFSLYLCRRFFGLCLGECVEKEMDGCGDFAAMCIEVTAFMENRNTLAATRFSGIHLRFQEDMGAKFFFIFRLLFTPTCKEWILFRLPYPLTFLYRIIRPLRLASGYIRNRWRGTPF